MEIIPYGRQSIADDDCTNVLRVLRSDFLTQGPEVSAFESELASYCETKEAVVFSSATAALHATYAMLGVGAGDVVWTVGNTFVATANAGRYCGAVIEFVDISSENLSMCPIALREALLAQTKRGHPLPKLIVPVHFAGLSSDMEKLSAVAGEYGCLLVEDASHALGGTYRGARVGSCKYSLASIFSFHPVKMITCGEGGAITTNNQQLAQRLRIFRSHGVVRNESEFINESHGPWYYEQQILGFNYRMNDIQAALGRSQLKKLQLFVERRQQIARQYIQRLHSLPLRVLGNDAVDECSFHLLVLILQGEPDSIKFSRDHLMTHLLNHGVQTQVHYIPVYRQPFHSSSVQHGCKITDDVYRRVLSIPIYPDLTDEQVSYICDCINQFFSCSNSWKF